MDSTPHRTRNLGNLILLRVLLATLLAMATFEFFSFQIGLQRSQKTFDDAVEVNMKRLQNSLLIPLWYMDDSVISQIMDAAVRDRMIKSLELIRSDGTRVYQTLDKNPSVPLPPEWPYRLLGIPLFRDTQVAVVYDDEPLGTLQMQSIHYQLWDTLQEMLLRMATEFMLFVILFTLLTAIGYHVLIRRPLDSILEGLQAIKGGNFQHPIKLDRQDEFWLMARDITDMSRELATMYARLENQNRSLEQTVQERTKSLVDSEKRALVSKLVAGVAHELNTPIGNVMTTNSYIYDQLEQFEQQVQAGVVRKSELDHVIHSSLEGSTIIKRNITTAAELIHNFRQVSTDLFSETRGRFNVLDNLHTLAPTLERILERAEARLELQGDPALMVTSFPNCLSQIVIALVLNAAVHGWTNGDSRDRLVLIEIAPWDQGVSIRCSNNGIALDGQTLSHLFEPFFSTRRQSGGKGLGLYIVKNMTEEQLTGHITVTSPLPGTEHGVAFEMYLPDLEYKDTETSQQATPQS